MAKFTAETAQKVAKINQGKVSENMQYVSFPGYWGQQQRQNFEARYDNVGITNHTGTWAIVNNPYSNSDFVRTQLVMISWD